MQIIVAFDIPDPRVTKALNGLKKKLPINQGETDIAYFKRILWEYAYGVAKQGMRELAVEALSKEEPEITVS